MVHTLPFRLVDKNRGKNVIQVTWVLLLKAHRDVGSATWLATVLWDFLGAIKKGLISRQGVAIEKGWHFGNTNLRIPHISDFKGCSKWLMLHG